MRLVEYGNSGGRGSNRVRSGSKTSESGCGVTQKVSSVVRSALSVDTGGLSRVRVLERQPGLCMFGVGRRICTEDMKGLTVEGVCQDVGYFIGGK